MFFPEGQVRVFLYGQPVNMREKNRIKSCLMELYLLKSMVLAEPTYGD